MAVVSIIAASRAQKQICGARFCLANDAHYTHLPPPVERLSLKTQAFAPLVFLYLRLCANGFFTQRRKEKTKGAKA
jgi:hypothetical protein